MPVAPTYPGVYIEEIPSGVRTITGVATSITAFLGRARRGPVNRPVTITSFADFERVFGGLWLDSTLGFAIRDFYRNGGAQAVVVRLYNPDGTDFKAQITAGDLKLEAADEGAWGAGLKVEITQPAADEITTEVAGRLGVAPGELFHLEVSDPSSGTEETFLHLSLIESSRRVDRVLAESSQLLRVVGGDLPTVLPDGASYLVIGPGPSDGKILEEGNYIVTGNPGPPPYFASPTRKTGLYALEDADLINLLVIPPRSFAADGFISEPVWTAAAAYATSRRAMVLVDPPPAWSSATAARDGLSSLANAIGPHKKNAALFFPCYRQPNPARAGQLQDVAPSGAVAGVMARTDAQRGVWKAAAGLDAGISGVTELCVPLTDAENGLLNPLGINCLRLRPAAGTVVWGARTFEGNDLLASEWKYVPVRRTALFIEESLYRGTQWVVFEPNDEPLWAQIRLNLGAFMQNLFRQGAFQGTTPRDAYFVKCDSETTTQNDIDRGIVNIAVGFAPLKPAEFVIIQLQQIAGQAQA
jgi:phage tail sheath protein FI